jgi:mycofactocin biosynthesis protein MftB
VLTRTRRPRSSRFRPRATTREGTNALSTSDAFDAGRPYALHPQLALRPEKFGALAYHYGNRRLTFLKSPQLTAIVESLGEYPSVDAALDAHGVTAAERPALLRALASLESSEVIGVR